MSAAPRGATCGGGFLPPPAKPKPPKMATGGLQETSKRVGHLPPATAGVVAVAAGACESGEAEAKPDEGGDVMRPEDFLMRAAAGAGAP